MKKVISLSFALIALYGAKAQSLVPDQNPNYMQSQQKYMGLKDSLLATENTTVQNTYKAYDWYQEKQQKKQDRIAFRRQMRLTNALYSDNYYYNNFGYYYPNSFHVPFYNHHFTPFIGYNSRHANWRFIL